MLLFNLFFGLKRFVLINVGLVWIHSDVPIYYINPLHGYDMKMSM